MKQGITNIQLQVYENLNNSSEFIFWKKLSLLL